MGECLLNPFRCSPHFENEKYRIIFPGSVECTPLYFLLTTDTINADDAEPDVSAAAQPTPIARG